jgi:hypothetical protein
VAAHGDQTEAPADERSATAYLGCHRPADRHAGDVLMTVVVAEGTLLIDALADQDIRPKSLVGIEGRDVRMRCPKCEGGRDREDSLSLKVDVGGMGAVWHCWRGTCGFGGNLIIGQRREQPLTPWRDRRNLTLTRPSASTTCSDAQ